MGLGGGVVDFFFSGPVSVLKTQYAGGNPVCRALAQNIVKALSFCACSLPPSLSLAEIKEKTRLWLCTPGFLMSLVLPRTSHSHREAIRETGTGHRAQTNSPSLSRPALVVADKGQEQLHTLQLRRLLQPGPRGTACHHQL